MAGPLSYDVTTDCNLPLVQLPHLKELELSEILQAMVPNILKHLCLAATTRILINTSIALTLYNESVFSPSVLPPDCSALTSFAEHRMIEFFDERNDGLIIRPHPNTNALCTEALFKLELTDVILDLSCLSSFDLPKIEVLVLGGLRMTLRLISIAPFALLACILSPNTGQGRSPEDADYSLLLLCLRLRSVEFINARFELGL
ncbi:hypothetical protein BKA93DRAFT_829466 [Sparassis latifolia]